MDNDSPLLCKLCGAPAPQPVPAPVGRTCLFCQSCGLIFVPPSEWLTVADERARYAHHDNHPSNAGYVAFLSQVADAAATLDLGQGRILDFGAGEEAVLSQILRQRGFTVTAYDPLYALDAIAGPYDLVILCEVIEHLRDLRMEMVRIGNALAPSGRILTRTQPVPNTATLADWWYARDPTHINFFTSVAMAAAAAIAHRPHVRNLAPDIFLLGPSPREP